MTFINDFNYTLSQLKIRYIFLFISAILSFVVLDIILILKLDFYYFISYFYFIAITFLWITTMSYVFYSDKPPKLRILTFLLSYLVIITTYIIFFAFLYQNTFLLEDGSFVKNDQFTKLIQNDYYTISAFNFLSFDIDFIPVGDFMIFFMFVQIFVSQIFILGTLFILLGYLINELKFSNI